MTEKRKLSDLIREGAKLRPQCQNNFFCHNTPTKELGSCALGAALEALGKAPNTEYSSEWVVPYLHEVTGVDFGTIDLDIREEGQSVYMQIVRANDKGQTREQIADWLESEGY